MHMQEKIPPKEIFWINLNRGILIFAIRIIKLEQTLQGSRD